MNNHDYFNEALDRFDLLDNLQTIEGYINIYNKRLERGWFSPIYRDLFPGVAEHQTEIYQKCKEFWMRKYNRILTQLKY